MILFIEVICGTPADGVNTMMVPDDLHLCYEESYIYSCIVGYETDEEVVTSCRYDGNWTLLTPPTCKRKHLVVLYF